MRKILLVLLVALLMPSAARATMCLPDGSERSQVREAFADSTVVFSRYVLDVTSGDEQPFARVKVLQVWKGPIEVGQVVETSAVESGTFMSDGIVPVAGTALLVYARAGSPYFLHTCSRTRELDPATGDIPELNKLSRKQRYRLGG
jgi:hypothetical protein